MRTLPSNPPPAVTRKSDATLERVSQTRRYRLITPLCGGGVDPLEADPVTVIRGSSIRGQLRFWWRATRGGAVGNLAEMRRREGEIWGLAAGNGGAPSQVQIAVKECGQTQRQYPFQDNWSRTGNYNARPDANVAPPYASFPLRPEDAESHKPLLRPFEFTLELHFPATAQADVEAALWAWETFGGIGARTRRGFGALCRLDDQGQPRTLTLESGATVTDVERLELWLREKLSRYVATGAWPSGVPHLAASLQFAIRQYGRDATSNWKRLVEKLQDFRQNRNPGSDPRNPRKLGRSRWPEPDQIRRLVPAPRRRHQPNHSVRKFPRAAFGLPIIFHFIDRDDPRDTTLKLPSSDRLASPLLLRPFQCSGGSFALAAVLQGNRLEDFLAGGNDLALENAPGNPRVAWRLDSAEARNINLLGYTPPKLGGTTDVLQAFLDTL